MSNFDIILRKNGWTCPQSIAKGKIFWRFIRTPDSRKSIWFWGSVDQTKKKWIFFFGLLTEQFFELENAWGIWIVQILEYIDSIEIIGIFFVLLVFNVEWFLNFSNKFKRVNLRSNKNKLQSNPYHLKWFCPLLWRLHTLLTFERVFLLCHSLQTLVLHSPPKTRYSLFVNKRPAKKGIVRFAIYHFLNWQTKFDWLMSQKKIGWYFFLIFYSRFMHLLPLTLLALLTYPHHPPETSFPIYSQRRALVQNHLPFERHHRRKLWFCYPNRAGKKYIVVLILK